MVTLNPSRLPQVRDDITRFCSSPILAMLLTAHRDQRGHHELPLPEARMAWHKALEAYQRRLVELAEGSHPLLCARGHDRGDHHRSSAGTGPSATARGPACRAGPDPV